MSTTTNHPYECQTCREAWEGPMVYHCPRCNSTQLMSLPREMFYRLSTPAAAIQTEVQA